VNILKIRYDYVTNSSSSSFIISKDQLSYGQLLKYLLQIANKEASNYKTYKWKDVEKNCVVGRYNITDATPENPYTAYEDFSDSKKVYTNHYIIDNDDCGRYDWDAIEEILSKHNIKRTFW
jgi:hypothetical protein